MPNELAGDSLPVCEHRWQVLYELPDFTREGRISLLIEQGGHSEPAGDHCLSRLS